jgi:hypothetical protein
MLNAKTNPINPHPRKEIITIAWDCMGLHYSTIPHSMLVGFTILHTNYTCFTVITKSANTDPCPFTADLT